MKKNNANKSRPTNFLQSSNAHLVNRLEQWQWEGVKRESHTLAAAAAAHICTVYPLPLFGVCVWERGWGGEQKIGSFLLSWELSGPTRKRTHTRTPAPERARASARCDVQACVRAPDCTTAIALLQWGGVGWGGVRGWKGVMLACCCNCHFFEHTHARIHTCVCVSSHTLSTGLVVSPTTPSPPPPI